MIRSKPPLNAPIAMRFYAVWARSWVGLRSGAAQSVEEYSGKMRIAGGGDPQKGQAAHHTPLAGGAIRGCFGGPQQSQVVAIERGVLRDIVPAIAEHWAS